MISHVAHLAEGTEGLRCQILNFDLARLASTLCNGGCSAHIGLHSGSHGTNNQCKLVSVQHISGYMSKMTQV